MSIMFIDNNVPVKRQKLSQPTHISSSNNSGYLQGMSLVINNSSGNDNNQFTAELSTQHITESSEIPGAIAIPIQVIIYCCFSTWYLGYSPVFMSFLLECFLF